MVEKSKEICPACRKQFTYLKRHKCKVIKECDSEGNVIYLDRIRSIKLLREHADVLKNK